MNASALASFATLSISSIDGCMSVPSKPYMIFRFRERANNVGSLRQSVSVHPRPQKQTFRHNGSQNSPCETIEILRPNHRGLSSCTCCDRQNSKQVYSKTSASIARVEKDTPRFRQDTLCRQMAHTNVEPVI